MAPIRDGNKLGPRARQRVPDWQATSVLAGLTSVGNYRNPSFGDVLLSANRFEENNDVWRAILSEVEITANMAIELRGFWLSEWLPLRPGLFHTVDAEYAREAALSESQILPETVAAPTALRDWLHTFGKHANSHSRLFNPDGKMSMINGGIGCVRLKSLPNRGNYQWLFGATSSGVVHEGIPIAIDDALRQKVLRDIRSGGGLRCNIRGVLRFVPRDDPLELMFGPGIPQVYLEVNDLQPISLATEERLSIEVTAVATFISREPDVQGLNATYVTFDAGEPGGLQRAVKWLDEIYVREAYKGRIVTDFDEQTRRFEHATFSLHKLLNGLVRPDAISNDLGLENTDLGKLANLLKGRQIYGDVYLAANVGAMGPGAVASNVTVTGRNGWGKDG